MRKIYVPSSNTWGKFTSPRITVAGCCLWILLSFPAHTLVYQTYHAIPGIPGVLMSLHSLLSVMLTKVLGTCDRQVLKIGQRHRQLEIPQSERLLSRSLYPPSPPPWTLNFSTLILLESDHKLMSSVHMYNCTYIHIWICCKCQNNYERWPIISACIITYWEQSPRKCSEVRRDLAEASFLLSVHCTDVLPVELISTVSWNKLYLFSQDSVNVG